MLVLTRKVGDGVVIGGHTFITVNRIAGKQVHLAFDTPLGTEVIRSELAAASAGKPLGFPVFYRVRRKADDTLAGYGLSLPTVESTRFYFEEIAGYRDVTDEDHSIGIYIFASEGEAYAMKRGMEISGSDLAHVVEGRQGKWLVLVDYGSEGWHDPAQQLEIYDFTVLRRGDTTGAA